MLLWLFELEEELVDMLDALLALSELSLALL